MNLYRHQQKALDLLQTGSILCGGVGCGKSRTALAFYAKVCGGEFEINGTGKYKKYTNPLDLYVITTAKKRDSLDWEKEALPFLLSTNTKLSCCGIKFIVDSWNNIEKYINIKRAFFIFDEQRVVGSGKWAKTFIKISKNNYWILATATPGDTWLDYIPVFVANGFYKNRSEFLRLHAVFNRYSKYPKIDKFIDTKLLESHKRRITVNMEYVRPTITKHIDVKVKYDKESMHRVQVDRWDIFNNEPVKEISGLCYTMRKVANINNDRLIKIDDICKRHKKVILFYNFNYELDILKAYAEKNKVTYAEWNGHKHLEIPDNDSWVYLVQYTAGAEGWNCIDTNAIIFYSLNYSYKVMIQAAGRIDRINTPFDILYYYYLVSDADIDKSIRKAINNKRMFNEVKFTSHEKHRL